MTDLDVAVVGAGIAGLTTAYRLSQQGLTVDVLESESEPGGRMRCGRIDGYTIDRGAETLAPYGYPATWELIRELGLEPEVHRIRHPVALWHGGRAHPWMGHPLSVLNRAGLSTRGWLAMARLMAPIARHPRQVVPERPESTPYGDLTLADIGRQHGEELVDRMLEPIAASAFGWLPEESAVAPLMAMIAATRGIWRWRTYRQGQDTMTRALADRVDVHLSKRVQLVKRDGDGARIELADGTLLSARAVVLAVPAPQVLDLHPDAPDEERPYLRACTFTSVMRVACLLDRPLEPVRRRFGPRLYAALLATGESPLLVGCTVEHNKCPERAPAGRGLVSLLISPRRVPELIDLPDEQVVRAVVAEGERLVPGLGDAMVGHDVVRWRHALPAAPPAALRLRGDFVRRPLQPIEYAGDWLYLRPSSEAATASARLAVPRIRQLLAG
ncbi:MAG: protoporphyrinogen/coproporphyrinogen oxidase [Frankiaceae bacterium]